MITGESPARADGPRPARLEATGAGESESVTVPVTRTESDARRPVPHRRHGGSSGRVKFKFKLAVLGRWFKPPARGHLRLPASADSLSATGGLAGCDLDAGLRLGPGPGPSLGRSKRAFLNEQKLKRKSFTH
jgi:hypothetical protein